MSREDEIKAQWREICLEIWRDAAERDHTRVTDWLRGAGLTPSLLPAGLVGNVLLYHPACYERAETDAAGKKSTVRGPAIIAPFSMPTGALAGLYRLFLDPEGKPIPRGVELGNAELMLGAARGRPIRLSNEYPDGVLVLTVGLESALAIMRTTGLPVWAFHEAKSLACIQPPVGVLAPDGPVHTVVIAASVSGRKLKADARAMLEEWIREKKPAAGQSADKVAGMAEGCRAGHIASIELWSRFPRVDYIVEEPDSRTAPGLVKPGDVWMGEPVDGVDEVTWPMVWAADAKAGRKSEGLLTSPEWRGLMRGQVALKSSPQTPSEPENGGDGTRSGEGDAAGGSEGGEGGAGGGDETPPWASHKAGDELPIIPEGTIEKARRYLWEKWRIDGQRRFGLVRWGSSFWVYGGGRYLKISEEEILSDVWNWCNGFMYVKGHGRSTSILKYTPTHKQVLDIVKALAIDTAARVDRMPARLPLTIDETGKPWWGKASRLSEVAAAFTAGVDELKDKMVFRNGVLDLAEVLSTGRVQLQPHTSEIFTATCLPFDLDTARLQGLVSGAMVPAEVYREVCPKFDAWLADACEGDQYKEDQYQEMLGDIVSSDRSIEKIYAYVGQRRSGKGYTEDIITALCGEDNVAAFLPDQLAEDRHALAPLVGKSVAIAPDAHVGRMAGSSKLVEIFKVISGRGRIPVRDLYQPSMTVKLGCRIVLFMNEEPDLQDESTALAGRFVFFPMRVSAFGREDPSIKDSVPREAAGIMLFAIMGALRLAKRKPRAISLCGEAEEASEEFERLTAHVKAFQTDWMGIDPTQDGLTVDEAYEAYVCHCAVIADRKPVGRRKFEMRAKYLLPSLWQPRQEDKRRDRRYKGTYLKAEAKLELSKWRAKQTRGEVGNWMPDAGGRDDVGM